MALLNILCLQKLGKKTDEYRRNAHSVTLSNYHFVFSKPRKALLVGDVKPRLQEIIFELFREHNWRLSALEIMPDYVHLFLEVDPTFVPSVMIKGVEPPPRRKGRASHHLRKEFPRLLKLPTLWTPSFFCATTLTVSVEAVRKYMESLPGK